MIQPSSPFIDNISPVKRKNSYGQFTDELAHELRNPPANISLSAQVPDTLTADNKLKLYLSIIIRGSIRINELITEWLSGKRTIPQQNSPERQTEAGLYRTGGHYNPR